QGGLASPTFALARGLFADPSWDAFSPERPLRQWRLIEINQPGAQPLTTSALRADERIVSFIKGLNYIDDRLAPLLIPFDAPVPGSPGQPPLPPSQQSVANQVAVSIRQRLETAGESLLVQMAGADGLSKQLIALEATRQVQMNLFRLPVEWLPQNAAELETLARLWERENILQPVALYLDARETAEVESPEAQAGALERFLARARGAVILDTREIRPSLGYRGLALDIEKPQPAEQGAAWAGLLGAGAGDWPNRLAGQFSLNIPTIQQIAAQAAQAVPDGGGSAGKQPALTVGDARPCDEAGAGAAAWQVCLSRTRPKLDRLAQRIDPKAHWGDIELPDEPLSLLQEIVGQVEQRMLVYETWGLRDVMNRGLGISALFAGESGTGKTMAAEVIANALCLNLYRIDLSAVVSKYIGETEKNLRRLFDAAEDGGVILFFDEADALFGKRSEVKDSHDRYANIEVNYLLQRMEAYHGLAILATNMKTALDQAFLRRLRFIVNFPFPGPADRRRIWQKAFPAGIPLDALDYERLARFNLTGGSIHNIAVNAAFLAAKQAIPVVTMEQVLQAVRSDLRKLEKPVNEKELDFSLDTAGRQLIWQEATRPDAPWLKGAGGSGPVLQAVDLDYAALARFDLSASQIYDAAGRAALRVAGSSGTAVIHMPDLMAEIKGEFERLGKPVNSADFPALPPPEAGTGGQA
ncbi:MAG TPA: ATP-binding protein, partial [Anaerolineaceae bacterium]